MVTTREACELLGGFDAVASALLNAIKQTGPDADDYFAGLDLDAPPSEAMQKISRDGLTRFFFVNEISSSDLFPQIQWTRETERVWKQKMEKSMRTAAADGESTIPEVALTLFVQDVALSEACGATDAISPEHQEARKNVRRKLAEMRASSV